MKYSPYDFSYSSSSQPWCAFTLITCVNFWRVSKSFPKHSINMLSRVKLMGSTSKRRILKWSLLFCRNRNVIITNWTIVMSIAIIKLLNLNKKKKWELKKSQPKIQTKDNLTINISWFKRFSCWREEEKSEKTREELILICWSCSDSVNLNHKAYDMQMQQDLINVWNNTSAVESRQPLIKPLQFRHATKLFHK